MSKLLLNILPFVFASFLFVSCESVVSESINEAEKDVAIANDGSLLVLNKLYVSMNSNASATIKVEAKNYAGNDDTITVKSMNEDIATVSVDGMTVTVNAVSNGTTEIVVNSGSGKSDSCFVKIVTVYAGGFSEDGYVGYPGYWKNGVWIQLKVGTSNIKGNVNTIVVSNGDVYAGGYLSVFASGTSDNLVPGYWKNGEWNKLADTGYVTSLVVSGSDVYAAGMLEGNYMSGYKKPGYWKNGVAHELTFPFTLYTYSSVNVYSLVVSGTDVYVQGEYIEQWEPDSGYWKNNEWISLSSSDNTMRLYSLFLSGSDIYAAGIKGTIPGYMKNGEWIDLPTYLSTQYSSVYTLIVSGSDVYAGGYNNKYVNNNFSACSGYWKNGEWIELTPENPKDAGYVKAIVVTGSDVYAGGYTGTSSNTAPGYWKNGEWNALPELDSVRSSQVFCIAVEE